MERLVHLGNIVRVEPVIGVEDEERVVPLRVPGGLHAVQQVGQRVAFADLLLVEPFDDMAAAAAGHVGGVVGAVVRHQPDVDQIGRVGLRVNRIDEIADDVRLVARGDQHREALIHRRLREAHRFAEQGDQDAHALIQQSRGTDNGQQNIQYTQQHHQRHPLLGLSTFGLGAAASESAEAAAASAPSASVASPASVSAPDSTGLPLDADGVRLGMATV